MNSFRGHIAGIETHGNLSLVTVRIGERQVLKAIVIDTPDTAAYLSDGHEVHVLFKETEVVIGAGEELAISLQNRITGHVSAIHRGALLSRVVVRTEIGDVISIVSTAAIEQLQLAVHCDVTAMIKLNEVLLST